MKLSFYGMGVFLIETSLIYVMDEEKL